MNIAHLLQRAGKAFSENTAIAVGDEAYSDYATLADRVTRMAGRLRAAFDLQVGDRVALTMKNSPQYIEILYACWHAGLVVVPINAKLHPKEFEYILEHSESRVCFTTSDLHKLVQPLQQGLPNLTQVIDVATPAYRALYDGEPSPMQAVNPTDLAWLFYTSGTTGRPKGAMLSHRNLMAMTVSYFSDVDPIAPGDSIIHAAPMSHGSGMYILPHVAAAATQVIPRSGGFEAEEICELIRAYRGVSFFAAPTMITRLIDSPAMANADTSNLKTIVYGGGPMYAEDCKRALKVLGPKLAQIYGQGESPMTITAMARHYFADKDHPDWEARIASAGVPSSMVQVRIADEDGNTLPDGEAGEILVRGDVVMNGYWRNEEATAKTIVDGWLHTGDVGAMDASGFVTLKDRTKDVIISGGTNIYPREIEEILLLDERVVEVSVVGEPHPDWGEVVVAFVVTRDGQSVSEKELEQLCLDNIARFKRPKAYHFLDALPKNNYGKVLKTDLRQRLEALREARHAG